MNFKNALLHSVLKLAVAFLIVLPKASGAQTPLTMIEFIHDHQTRLPNQAELNVLNQQGIRFYAYNLDAPKQVSVELSQGLPANPALAKQILLEKLNVQGATLQKRYQAAYLGLTKSLQYGLDRYPAWVFNEGQAVVYGTVDLNQALLAFQNGAGR